MKEPISPIQLKRWQNDTFIDAPDLLAVEEPLEIRLGYGEELREQRSLVVTMRTPGNDFELALGFLFTEGIIKSGADVESVKYCEDVGRQEEKGNVVRVELKRHVKIEWEKLQRNFYSSSSCGVCGKSSIDSVRLTQAGPMQETWQMSASDLANVPQKLREAQVTFARTGGIHAVGVFDPGGNLLLLREDIGRHNALDKIIGALFQQNKLPGSNLMVAFSGRAGFELIQKSIAAGFPILAAIGAPSSLAVSLAKEAGATLVGFLGNHSFNIYCGEQRVNQ